MQRKKISVIAVAVALPCALACAQSNVTLFGVADITLSRASQGGATKTYLTQGGLSASRLGVQGTEDLGGGYGAGVWLEGSVNLDDGTVGDRESMIWNRRSTVDLTTPVGALRLGRDYMPDSWNHVVFDPFGTSSGAGVGTNITGVFGANVRYTVPRSSRSISYLYGMAPNADSHGVRSLGFYAQVSYAFPDTSAKFDVGRYAGARVGYRTVNWNVAMAYAKSTGTLPFGPPSLVNYKAFNVGASYKFDSIGIMAKAGFNDSDHPANPKNTWWGVGAVIPVGPTGYVPVSFNRVRMDKPGKPGAMQLAVGYVYNLSKRTAIYVTQSHITNQNGGTWSFVGNFTTAGNPGFFGTLAGKGSGNATDIGIRHSF